MSECGSKQKLRTLELYGQAPTLVKMLRRGCFTRVCVCACMRVMTLADGSASACDSLEAWLWYLQSLGKLDTLARMQHSVSVSTFGHNVKNAVPILHIGLVFERDPSEFFSSKVTQTFCLLTT